MTLTCSALWVSQDFSWVKFCADSDFLAYICSSKPKVVGSGTGYPQVLKTTPVSFFCEVKRGLLPLPWIFRLYASLHSLIYESNLSVHAGGETLSPLTLSGRMSWPFSPGSLFVLRENTPSPRSAQRKHSQLDKCSEKTPPAGRVPRENTPAGWVLRLMQTN